MYVIMYAATVSQRTTRRTRLGDSVVAETLSRVFEGAAAFRSAIKFPRASSGPRFSKAVRWLWSLTSNVRVSDHPVCAPLRRLRGFFQWAQPPLLCKEGNAFGSSVAVQYIVRLNS